MKLYPSSFTICDLLGIAAPNPTYELELVELDPRIMEVGDFCRNLVVDLHLKYRLFAEWLSCLPVGS
jgi:hypothetical protein